jgi:hypothetical protein
MDNAIVVAFISVGSVCIGAVISGCLQWINQKQQHKNLLAIEAIKSERERLNKKHTYTLSRIVEAHKLLGKIAREFSTTNLVKLQNGGIMQVQYDQLHSLVCSDVDELMAIAGLDLPTLLSDTNAISSQMVYFWANFTLMTSATTFEPENDWPCEYQISIHKNIDEINTRVRSAQAILQDIAKSLNGPT